MCTYIGFTVQSTDFSVKVSMNEIGDGKKIRVPPVIN